MVPAIRQRSPRLRVEAEIVAASSVHSEGPVEPSATRAAPTSPTRVAVRATGVRGLPSGAAGGTARDVCTAWSPSLPLNLVSDSVGPVAGSDGCGPGVHGSVRGRPGPPITRLGYSLAPWPLDVDMHTAPTGRRPPEP